MKQSISERVKEFEKQLDNRPSNCKCCKLIIDNGIAEFICERTERHTFFGMEADKCHGDCDLYEKDIPEMLEDTIYGLLKSQIEKLKAEPENNESVGNTVLFESGYLKCQKDVLEIIDKMSGLRRKNHD